MSTLGSLPQHSFPLSSELGQPGSRTPTRSASVRTPWFSSTWDAFRSLFSPELGILASSRRFWPIFSTLPDQLSSAGTGISWPPRSSSQYLYFYQRMHSYHAHYALPRSCAHHSHSTMLTAAYRGPVLVSRISALQDMSYCGPVLDTCSSIV